MYRDRVTVFETFGKIVAFHNPRQRVLRRKLNHPSCAQTVAPFGVVADFGFFRIKHQTGLREIGHGIFLDLFARQGRTGDISSARVSDHRGEIADQENHDMAEILKLAHLVQYYRMAQMQIRSGRVQSEFDPQGLSCLFGTGQFPCEFGFDQQFVTASQGDCQRFPDRRGQGQFFDRCRLGIFFVHLTYLRRFVLI